VSNLNPDQLLSAPLIEYSDQKVADFEILYRNSLSKPGSEIDYNLSYPKYEFLSYLVEHQEVLMHGSNNPGIEVFEPRTQTDYVGRVIQAVFATSDGIWPMFFAIIRREGYRGSLRNACVWRPDQVGVQRKFYYFSINASALAGQPWTAGMMYILPRASFSRILTEDGKPLEEWASSKPVRPLARLHVVPVDFPFLKNVQGHDDRWSDLLEIVLSTYTCLEELEDGFALGYVPEDNRLEDITSFIQLLGEIQPQIQAEIRFQPGDDLAWLRLTGSQEIKTALAHYLGRS
jgi:hypothetical protein